MKSVNLNNDLDFLSNYWKHANDIALDIRRELPKGQTKVRMIGKHLGVIMFSELKNWDVKGMFGGSPALQALGDKISAMISKGDAVNVQPMILSIVQRGVKKQSHPPSRHNKRNYGSTAEFLGVGHFRWNYTAYELTAEELQRVKTYFNV
jgi:hypothetical protein